LFGIFKGQNLLFKHIFIGFTFDALERLFLDFLAKCGQGKVPQKANKKADHIRKTVLKDSYMPLKILFSINAV